MGKCKLIINADDFGHSDSYNSAIVTSFENGYITSTTIMTNMAGFDSACKLAFDYSFEKKIGLHLNLTEGFPLTNNMAQNTRFCDENNMFRKNTIRNNWFASLHLSKKDRIDLQGEIRAQLNRLIGKGINPTHIDSHHHVHITWSIGCEVKKIAKEYGIPSIRLSDNICIRHPKVWMHNFLYNAFLRRQIPKLTTFFGSAKRALKLSSHVKASVEVMVHPRLAKGQRLIDMTNILDPTGATSKDMKITFKELIEYFTEVDLIGYGEL